METSDFHFLSAKLSDQIEVEFDQVQEESSLVIDFSDSLRSTKNLTVLSSSIPLEIEVKSNFHFSEKELEMLRLYLPYALLPFYAAKNKKCYAISHFAQTLDGRIASHSGDSKWIGNEENLIHAHRMRALCDAILIGSKTLNQDNPRLNVRLVKGKNPVKVIIGGDDLAIDDYQAVDDNTIMFCQNHFELNPCYEKISLKKNVVYSASQILKSLWEKGINSVYIEGGSFTTSNFLKQEALDQIQLHISPKIIGSGTNSFAFSGIIQMDEAIQFKQSKFIAMGSEIMFMGNLG
ncbi:RibD family protein [Flexithrix dorotheae]|uniref:RibD family protein n=1 Tax=Flexithrix dorotheae TaxID=70993 RepID=UPI0003709724|nr:RibD family protein [Flexithrix dorotheae]